MNDETEGAYQDHEQLVGIMYDLQHERDQYRENLHEVTIERDNLVMLVRRLCRELPADNRRRIEAMDALSRWKLLTPLRGET